MSWLASRMHGGKLLSRFFGVRHFGGEFDFMDWTDMAEDMAEAWARARPATGVILRDAQGETLSTEEESVR